MNTLPGHFPVCNTEFNYSINYDMQETDIALDDLNRFPISGTISIMTRQDQCIMINVLSRSGMSLVIRQRIIESFLGEVKFTVSPNMCRVLQPRICR